MRRAFWIGLSLIVIGVLPVWAQGDVPPAPVILNTPAPAPVVPPAPVVVIPPVPTPTNVPYIEPVLNVGDTVVLLDGRVNLRTVPSTGIESDVIAVLQAGERLTVLGFTSGREWVQVTLRQPDSVVLTGWVFGEFVALEGPQSLEREINAPPPDESGFQLVANNTVIIRERPLIFYPQIGVLPEGDNAQIIGRKSTYNWWKINYRGTVGWVAREYVDIQNPASYSEVPIVND